MTSPVPDRRTVVTGLGVCSPIGSELTAFWEALRAGRSGIRRISLMDVSPLPCQIAGEITDFDPRKTLDKKQQRSLRMMARTVQLGVVTAAKAVENARFDRNRLDPERFGVVFGAGMISTELEDLSRASALAASEKSELDLRIWGEAGLREIPPLWMLKYLPNMPACHVSIFQDARGPNNSITVSEAASLLAIGEAHRTIARGLADVMLAGGADSKLDPLAFIRHTLFQKLSTRNDAPEKACRPFDRHRDGLVLGEGGGVLVLEDYEHAQARGATIYAEVVGFAAGFDAAKDGSGLARTIQRALAEAQIGPEQIDHINAHGLSSPEDDIREARAIATVFGNLPVPVWAAKSYFGNAGASGSSLELIGSILALRHGELPVTLNYETPDPACPIAVHANEKRPTTQPYVLKLAFSDLGQCGALVLRIERGANQ